MTDVGIGAVQVPIAASLGTAVVDTVGYLVVRIFCESQVLESNSLFEQPGGGESLNGQLGGDLLRKVQLTCSAEGMAIARPTNRAR